MGIETTDLWKLVLERAELTPQSEMLVDEQGRRLTFLEYKIASQQMAAGLYELGVKEGDHCDLPRTRGRILRKTSKCLFSDNSQRVSRV